jgi:hypothetical protein
MWTGAVLSLAYITLFVIPTVLSAATTREIGDLVVIALLFYIFGAIFGVLPAILLGGATALLIWYTLSRASATMTPLRASATGAVICLALAALLSIGYWAWLAPAEAGGESGGAQLEGYFFYIGLPSILYLIGGAWMGYRLHRGTREGQDAEAPHETP